MQRRFEKRRIISIWTIFFFACLIGVSACGQKKRPFAPEDLLNLKSLSDPQISPDGDWIAFVATQFGKDKKTDSEVWIVSSESGTLKRLTNNPGPDFSPRWSPDGKILAFISRRDKERNSQIYFYSLRDKKVKKETDERASIRDLKWAPGNKKIAFLMPDPLTEEELERQKKGDDAYIVDQDIRHTRLWIFDVESRTIRLLTHQDMTIWHFNWSPESSEIVVLASPIPTAEGNEYQSHLSLIDAQTGEETILVKKTSAQVSPSFSPDGKWIAYMGPVGNFKERGIIRVVSAEGGESIDLLKDYEGNVWDVIWHPKKTELLASVAKELTHYLVSVDIKGQVSNLVQMDHSIIPYWGNFWSLSADGNHVAFLNEKIDSPKEIWVSRTDGEGKKQLTDFNSYLKEITLGKVEEVRWTNPEDGSDVNGILVKPPDFDSNKRYPLVVWFHGGPAYNWSLGIQVSNWAQLFASQGYMVFLPNFRGSSGKGMKWMMANVENWGEGPMSDVMSGVDNLINKGWVDKERLFVGGGSYGGYLTSWVITHTAKFKAAYVSAGVSDLVTEYALTDEPSFLIGYFNSTPYDNPQIYRSNSPFTYAAQAETPVLIVHGERDLRVPVSQAYQFYSALKHFGAKAKLVIYPREYHGVREYSHQIDLMNLVLEWFKKH
jgi:dipeptidyl aminopeptidase/acylaminoacyl peptidase